jgi:hypothetical protein
MTRNVSSKLLVWTLVGSALVGAGLLACAAEGTADTGDADDAATSPETGGGKTDSGSGGDDGSTADAAPGSRTVGGSVSGLTVAAVGDAGAGSDAGAGTDAGDAGDAGPSLPLGLVLANGAETLAIAANGAFTFPTALAQGEAYAVTIAVQPTSPHQTCTVSKGTGTIGATNVTDVAVSCAVDTYAVSGTISGLDAAGLGLTNTYTGGGGPEVLAPASGATTFAFTQKVKSGESYAVTVSSQPAGRFCGVTNGSGTITGASVNDVAITCGPAKYDFTYSGADETFTVPAGVTLVDVVLEGAQGGSDEPASQNYGGKLTATLPVTPGEALYLFVGGKPAGEAGGFNGGGAGDATGFGGGGASDIRRGGKTLADRVLVTGGGGGAGTWSNLEIVGGKGGGLTGGAGLRVPDNAGGAGATQDGSGTGTCVSFDNLTVSGGLGFGGTTVGKGCGCEGYGGGGGYYGGAASGNCRGGGGGSAFVAAAANAMNVVHTLGGAAPGNGAITITAK